MTNSWHPCRCIAILKITPKYSLNPQAQTNCLQLPVYHIGYPATNLTNKFITLYQIAPAMFYHYEFI